MPRVESKGESPRMVTFMDALGDGDARLTAAEVRDAARRSSEAPLRELIAIDGFEAHAERLARRIVSTGPMPAPPATRPNTVRFVSDLPFDGSLVDRVRAGRRLLRDPSLFHAGNAVALVRWLQDSLAWALPSPSSFRRGEARALFEEVGMFVQDLEDRLYSFGRHYTKEHQEAVVAANRLRSYTGDYLLINYRSDFPEGEPMPRFVEKASKLHFQCFDPSFRDIPSVDAFPDVFLLSMDSGSSVAQVIKRVTAEDGYESHVALVIRGREGKHYLVEAGTGFGADAKPLDLVNVFESKGRVRVHFLRDSAFASPEAKKAFFEKAKGFVDLIRAQKNPYDFGLSSFDPPPPGERLRIDRDTPLMCGNLVQAFFYWVPFDAHASQAHRESFGVVHQGTGRRVAAYTPFLAKFDEGAGTQALLDRWGVRTDRTAMPASVHNPLTQTVAEVRSLKGDRLEQQQIDNAATAFLMNDLLNKRGYHLDESLKARALRALIMGLHTLTFRSLLPLERDRMSDDVMETVLIHMFAATPFIEHLTAENQRHKETHGVGMTFQQLVNAAKIAYDRELAERRAGRLSSPKFTNYVIPVDLLPTDRGQRGSPGGDSGFNDR